MQIMIHACPQRMWYVNEFLIPSLEAQGAEDVRVWLDANGRGNLRSCVESFASLPEEGGTWHLQDDVLPCRDFFSRACELEPGTNLVYGFCSVHNGDDPGQRGAVCMPDAWHGFPCVRIPNAWAREFVEWFDDAKDRPDMVGFFRLNKGDDWFFTQFLEERHGMDIAYNAKPCLVEHVDFLLGGSILNEWRGYWLRAEWFEDGDLVDELAKRVKEMNK